MEHVEKHHNLNFIEQKDKLNSSLVTVNKKINSELNNLELKYSNRELPISKYEVTKKKLIDSYKQKVDQLTKVAQTTYKNFTSKIWNWKFTSRFEEDRLRNVGKRALLAANASKLLFLFLFIAIITAFQSPNYFSSYNWFIAILKSNVFIGFIAMGETLAILTAGIDLSVGSLIGFGATLYLYFTVSLGMHFILSLVLMIVIMVILGFTNGFLISKFKIPPFIITLAGLLTLRGGINVILKGTPISNLNDPIFNFLNTDLGNNFHVLLLIFIIVAVVAVFLLKYTKSGRYIYAVGDNPEAAKISGIKNNWILMLVYGFSATFAIGGALSAASLTTSVSPNTGFGFELDAITAVVLGGTALSGGKGGIGKTIIGWFAVAILLNSFAFFNVDSNYQQIAKGLIIIVAVIFNKNTRIIERLKKLYLKTLKYRILIVNHKKIY
ncbi:ribose ABC transporter [Mycoplasma testudineum]|nr:ribose ABC transporter [Mycoplasma testudineum]